MVEGSGFENRRSRKATRGSNPLSSAKSLEKVWVPDLGCHNRGQTAVGRTPHTAARMRLISTSAFRHFARDDWSKS